MSVIDASVGSVLRYFTFKDFIFRFSNSFLLLRGYLLFLTKKSGIFFSIVFSFLILPQAKSLLTNFFGFSLAKLLAFFISISRNYLKDQTWLWKEPRIGFSIFYDPEYSLTLFKVFQAEWVCGFIMENV